MQDAAKVVGVSRKSLDDYYYQIRLGELYHFDFYQNLEEKIGQLRAYVKSNMRGSKAHGKLPHYLKIFAYLDGRIHKSNPVGVPLTYSHKDKYAHLHSKELELGLIGADPPMLSKTNRSK